ncbi:diacylglycerol kinase family protein [Albimonas sp. CAU 1670]|uniref:diacylglycerol/lipid kinase family protein n=1 Tax=Albimonas sp. CAU 1670 TaxID=3032599 RepID=UPI0023DBE16F|nr:diacylglycerol kinase family protein [Albimonas sp. CAU 1670]MDF2232324.1 diacylglycerol kinase family protein [Albimonas sp. CAU 1670]
MSSAHALRPDDPPEAGGAPRRRAEETCVILNAGSGRKRAEELAATLEREFARYGLPARLRLIRKGRDLEPAAREAADEGFGTVVAGGGDGTINAVAGAIAGTGARLGVIPLGTFNYVARSLGLPETPEEAVGVLANGAPRPLPLGEVNGRVFLNNASLGAYAKILETRESVYRRWGRSRVAAHWSVITALAEFRAPLDAKVTVDGDVHRVRTPLAFVANNAFQLEEFDFHEAAERVRGGEFALFLAPDREAFDLIRFAAALGLKALKPGRDFEMLYGKDIEVATRRSRRLVARDGEREKMQAPFRFLRLDDKLEVIAPAEGT